MNGFQDTLAGKKDKTVSYSGRKERVGIYLETLEWNNELNELQRAGKLQGMWMFVASALRGEKKDSPACTVGLTHRSNALCNLVDETTTAIKDYFLWHSKACHILQPLIDNKIKLIWNNLKITKLSRRAFDSIHDSMKQNFKVNV